MKITKRKVVNYLKAKGVSEDVDDMMIDLLLATLTVVKAASKDVEENGIFDTDDRGNTKISPAAALLNNSAKTLMSISRKLGLSPLDRTALGLSIAPEEDDGFDD